jgi:hypothetical protein
MTHLWARVQKNLNISLLITCTNTWPESAQGIEAGNVQSGGTERSTYVAESPTRLAKRSFRFFFGAKFCDRDAPQKIKYL